MKHYPHHIGDFDRATRHLTRLERSIYRDLIELYYDTESRLTLDLPVLCRKILARSNEESTAVEQTLNEFFTRTEAGWYQDRCEAEIEAYRANTSQRAMAGKASAAAKALKKHLAINGNSTGVERALNGSSDLDATKYNGAPTNQSTNQPINQSTNQPKGEETVVFEQPECIEQPPALKTGAICIVLKSEGIGSVNPSHPELLALIDAGAEVGHFSAAAKASAAKGKASFSYVLAVVKGQMRDAALLAKEAMEKPVTSKKAETFDEINRRHKREQWEEMTGRKWDDSDDSSSNVIDITPEELRISQ